MIKNSDETKAAIAKSAEDKLKDMMGEILDPDEQNVSLDPLEKRIKGKENKKYDDQEAEPKDKSKVTEEISFEDEMRLGQEDFNQGLQRKSLEDTGENDPDLEANRTDLDKVTESVEVPSGGIVSFIHENINVFNDTFDQKFYASGVPISFIREGENFSGLFLFGEDYHFLVEFKAEEGNDLITGISKFAYDMVSEQAEWTVLFDASSLEENLANVALLLVQPEGKLSESKKSDIEEFLSTADTDKSVSSLYRDYFKWARDNKKAETSEPHFRSVVKQMQMQRSATEEGMPQIQHYQDTFETPIEYDDFEKEIMENDVFYKYEMMGELVKKIVLKDSLYKNVFIYGVGGIGKELRNSSPVFTPNGKVPIGDLKINDLVFGTEGVPTKVTGVYPQGIKPIYEMILNDGSKIYPGKDHTFTVYRTDRRQQRKNKKSAKKQDLTVEQILEIGIKDKLNRRRFALPTFKPFEIFNAKKSEDFIIHPYVLGALLGDGGMSTKSSVNFSYHKDDIATIKKIESLSKNLNIRISESKSDTGEVVNLRFAGKEKGKNELVEALRALGLMGHKAIDKFIPVEYIEQASVKARIELLRGLMDTDGSIFKTQSKNIDYYPTQFYTSSAKLNVGVLELVRSLGGKASSTQRNAGYKNQNGEYIACHDRYEITVTFGEENPINPFSLERKAKKWKPSHQNRKTIESIKPYSEELATCITVEAENKLFIAEDYVVTHNTFTVEEVIGKYATPGDVVTYKGAISGFTGLLQVLWENRDGKIIVFDDNDGILTGNQQNASNLLKGAMEMSDPRILSYSRFKRKKESLDATEIQDEIDQLVNEGWDEEEAKYQVENDESYKEGRFEDPSETSFFKDHVSDFGDKMAVGQEEANLELGTEEFNPILKSEFEANTPDKTYESLISMKSLLEGTTFHEGDFDDEGDGYDDAYNLESNEIARAESSNDFDVDEFKKTYKGELDPDIDPAFGLGPDDEIPDKFQFNSRIIFISNLMKVPQPLFDRTYAVGLLLTKEQILDLIDSKLGNLMKDQPQITLEDKKETLKFMRKYLHRAGKTPTFRGFQQLIALYTSDHPDAKKLMYIAYTSGSGMKTNLR